MDKIQYLLAGVLLAFWFFFFMVLSWDDKKSRSINLTMGVLSFVVAGAAYILPFWLLTH